MAALWVDFFDVNMSPPPLLMLSLAESPNEPKIN